MKTKIVRSKAYKNYLLVGFLGGLFAIGISQLWTLSGRWFIVSVAGIMLISLSMVVISQLSDFLTWLLFMCIPLAGFKKLYIPASMKGGISLFSGTVGIGLIEFLIIGLYISWFFEIFIIKSKTLPSFHKMDRLMGLLLGSYIISLLGVAYIDQGLSTTLYLVEHMLIYFYFSKNLNRRYIRWFMTAVIFTIMLEASMGILQSQAGMFQGWARDKGARSEELGSQYTVAGIEGFYRADGTMYDSHELGHLLVLLLPLPFVFMLTNKVSRRYRFICSSAFLLGAIGLAATFSRSGWAGFVPTIVLTMGIYALYWREDNAFIAVFICLGVAIVLSPCIIYFVFTRFATAPSELVTSRFEQYKTALQIWRDHPIFGYGAGNYMHALETYGEAGYSSSLPVHNMPLWTLVDTGLFGFTIFYLIFLEALRRFWHLIKAHDGIDSFVALSLFVGLIGSFVDGLADPSLRGPSVYLVFWLFISLSVALPRIKREEITHSDQQDDRALDSTGYN